MALGLGGGLTRSRVVVFDWLRVLATLLVVHHHASLAYTASPYRRWYVLNEHGTLLFDAIVRLVEPFMMPAFFLIAGYLTARSLRPSSSPRPYVRRRLERLGVPFIVGVLVLVPALKYLQRLDQLGLDEDGFASYWVHTYLGEDIRAGYLWFLSLLLVFQLVAWSAVRRWPSLYRARPEGARQPPRWSHVALFVVLVAAGQFAAHLVFGDYEWVEWLGTGVITFQPTRLAIYAGSFAVGIWGWRQQWSWAEGLWGRPGAALAVAMVAAVAQLGFSYFFYAGVADSIGLKAVNAVLYAATSAALLSAALAWCGRATASRGSPAWLGRLSAASYATYVLHMPIVVAAQYLLLPWPASPIVKYLLVLTVGVLGSFTLADVLIRRVRLAGRLLAGG